MDKEETAQAINRLIADMVIASFSERTRRVQTPITRPKPIQISCKNSKCQMRWESKTQLRKARRESACAVGCCPKCGEQLLKHQNLKVVESG